MPISPRSPSWRTMSYGNDLVRSSSSATGATSPSAKSRTVRRISSLSGERSKSMRAFWRPPSVARSARAPVRVQARSFPRVIRPGRGIVQRLRRRDVVRLAVQGAGAVRLDLGLDGVPQRIAAALAMGRVLDQVVLRLLEALLLAATGLVDGLHRGVVR